MTDLSEKIVDFFKKKSSTSRVQIPKSYLQMGVAVFCIFILGGGVYNILENPPTIIPLQNGYTSLHPYMSDQTVTEGYVVMLMNTFMVIGFLLAYKSTQVERDRKRANRYLALGILFIALGLLGNYTILNIKRNLLR